MKSICILAALGILLGFVASTAGAIETTIYAIQLGQVPPNTEVTVRNAVVTATGLSFLDPCLVTEL